MVKLDMQSQFKFYMEKSSTLVKLVSFLRWRFLGDFLRGYGYQLLVQKIIVRDAMKCPFSRVHLRITADYCGV